MRRGANIPISKKLVLMQLVTTVSVVIICSATFLFMYHDVALENKTKSLLSIAKVLGSNAEAPVIFKDNDEITKILDDLKVEADISNACIIDTSMAVLGCYTKKGAKPYVFTSFSKEGVTTNSAENSMFIYYKIVKDNEWVGVVCLRIDIAQLQSELNEVFKVVCSIVLGGFLVAFFISRFLQRYISGPINSVVDVTENIIQSQNYSLRSPVEGKDEIGKMSFALNKMLDQIEHHAAELSETNNLLEARVKQRTETLNKQNEKLIIATEAAEQSKKVKEQFLASMSHEIRTPLNAIIGFQALLKETPLNEEQKEYIESIDFAGKNLLVIVNDILDISKIEAGKLTLSKDNLNIEHELSAIVELIKLKAKEKNIEVTLNHDVTIPKWVVGDVARFNQIILNLLGNAIKFTEKGYVKVRSRLLRSEHNTICCEFEITDTGIGIPKNKQKEIFERFSQASSDTSRKYGGTGLGLTIVKHLLKLQGGDVLVQSEEGKGSVFTVHLNFDKSTSNVIEPGQFELNTLNEITDGKKLNILLAEDTLLNQRLVKKIVEKWGFNLTIANNGIEAIALHKKNKYDIILMDIQMPEMDGYTTTQEIRALEGEEKKSIPIIALTAHASQDEAEKCIKLGMNTYISKPFDAMLLKNIILQLTSKNELKSGPNLFNVVNDSNKLYDLSYLKDHAEGDYVFLTDMIHTFLTDTPEFISQLQKDIFENDYAKIKITSHSMKGLFLTLGMNDAARCLKEIETMAIEHTDIQLIEGNFVKVAHLFLAVKQPLETDFDEFKKLMK
ncbi:MAG TPA: response regulator [Bacteroidia bacterium]|nr:response regulator [Bacteroidia bacterium]